VYSFSAAGLADIESFENFFRIKYKAPGRRILAKVYHPHLPLSDTTWSSKAAVKTTIVNLECQRE